MTQTIDTSGSASCTPREFAPIVEKAVAKWFISRGASVLTVRDLGGRAKLYGRCTIITPDLLLFGGDELFQSPTGARWIEVKSKRSSTATRSAGGDLQTGFEEFYLNAYNTVRKITGLDVYVSFAIEDDDVITYDSLERITPLGRLSTDIDGVDGGRRPSVYWSMRDLTVIGRFEELRPAINQGLALREFQLRKPLTKTR